MYSTSQIFKSLMALPSRTLTTRGTITYPDTATQALTADEISSIQVTEDAGAHLPLGGVSASSLTLALDNRLGEWNAGGSILGVHSLDGAAVQLEIGVLHPGYSATPESIDGGEPDTTFTESVDGGSPSEVFTATIDGGDPETFPLEYYWSNIGTFILENATGQEQQTLITLKGSDALANLALTTFTDGLTYPKTLAQILTEACTQAGITPKSTAFTNSTVSILVKPVWGDVTCRDIIGYIACCAAGFARIDRDGRLEIVSFDDTSDYAVDVSRYKTLEHQAVFGPFNALSVYEFGAPNGTGATRIATDIDIVDTELNSIAVQSNPILGYNLATTSTIMTEMLASLAGLTFVGGSILWQGDPSLTTGDCVTVTDLSSDDYIILVLNQSLKLGNGFEMTSGNKLNTNIIGAAKTAYMRVFTPTGKLNATALEGDIIIKAGNQLNLLAGANLVVASGGLLNLSATNQIVFTGGSSLADMLGATGIQTHTGSTAPGSPNTGDLWFDTGNYNLCKRWNGSTWDIYTQGKLANSKMTLDATGIALLSGGTFTVASTNFMIDSSGNVSMKGTITSSSGAIGGFSIGSTSLSASPSGKPTMTLDTGNSKMTLGNLQFRYGATSYPEIYSDMLFLSCSDGFFVGTDVYNTWFNVLPSGYVNAFSNLTVYGTCYSQYGFVDFTPAYTGKSALSELRMVKNDKDGNIDHQTLPPFAKKRIKMNDRDKGERDADGRDIGAMISILTKAVQELDERIDKIV